MSMFQWVKPGYHNSIADFTALASFTSEDSLLKGVAKQPVIPRGFWERPGATFMFRASGVFSTTGTPTMLWNARLKATVGVTQLDGTIVAGSAAITLANGVTNDKWDLCVRMACRTPGQGSGNTTINCDGRIDLIHAAADMVSRTMVPTTGTPQTWAVATAIQNDVDMYLNLTATCGTSSASNTLQCKMLEWWYY